MDRTNHLQPMESRKKKERVCVSNLLQRETFAIATRRADQNQQKEMNNAESPPIDLTERQRTLFEDSIKSKLKKKKKRSERGK